MRVRTVPPSRVSLVLAGLRKARPVPVPGAEGKADFTQAARDVLLAAVLAQRGRRESETA